MSRSPHVLILSTADWDRPLWTNKQHLASRLAPHVRVTYVDSLALRRPGLSREDLARIGSKVRAALRPARSGSGPGAGAAGLPENLSVVSPRVIPFHRRRPVVWSLNRASLRQQLKPWLATPHEDRVLWAFSPVTYDLELEASQTIYHCVDLLQSFPGVDGRALDEGELRLARAGAIGIASSRPLADHLRSVGFERVLLWENVADVELMASQAVGPRSAGSVVFAGNLTPTKVDVEILRAIADSGDLELHLAGPIADGGGTFPELAWVHEHPRVVLHGVLSPAQLGALLGTCTVGVIPYLVNDYTTGVFPMKVYEYLAAGLAVVSTPLPALDGNGDVGVVSGSSAAFVDAVRARAGVPASELVAERFEAARSHSWEARAEAALGLISQPGG